MSRTPRPGPGAGPARAAVGRPEERRPARERLRVLLVSAEVAPFARTGGLGDVAGALPQALARLGHDVRVIMPRHRGVEAAAGALEVAVPRLAVPIADRTVEGAILEGRLGERVPVYFVAQDGYYDRPALYGASDDCERFVFFCRSVLAALPALGWMPQVVHAHDWQAGLVPVYLETLYRDTPAYADVATVFTVHNLAYQGVFWHYDLPMTGLGWDLFTPAGIEFYGHLSLLKGGMQIPGGKIFGGLLIETSAEYPVAAAVLILDAVIVARARGKVAAFFPHSFATSVIPPPRGEVGLRSKPGGGLLAEDSITPPGSAFSRATLPIKGRDGACCAVTAS